MSKSKDTTKEKLLQAAVKVFARKGFIAATVREICAEAGANVAAVNYHFRGKESLYHEVLRHIFGRSCHKGEACVENGTATLSPEERLAVFIRASCSEIYGEFIQEDEGWDMGAIFLSEMARPTEHLDRVVQEFAGEKHKVLELIISDYLNLPTEDPVVLECKFSIMSQIMHQAIFWPLTSRIYPELKHPRHDPNALADHVLMFSLGGLKQVRCSLQDREAKGCENE